MGDGIETIAKFAIAALGSGTAGLVHGAIDSTEFGESMHPYIHTAANALPPIASGIYVASSKYGFGTNKERALAGGAITVATAVIQTATYYAGRIIVEGTKKVLS